MPDLPSSLCGFDSRRPLHPPRPGQPCTGCWSPEAAGQRASSVLDASYAGDYRRACRRSFLSYHGVRPNALRPSIPLIDKTFPRDAIGGAKLGMRADWVHLDHGWASHRVSHKIARNGA